MLGLSAPSAVDTSNAAPTPIRPIQSKRTFEIIFIVVHLLAVRQIFYTDWLPDMVGLITRIDPHRPFKALEGPFDHHTLYVNWAEANSAYIGTCAGIIFKSSIKGSL